MTRRNIVVIGASAGGVEALTELVARLPADFPGSIFIVLHVLPYGPSFLPEILSRAGPLPAVHAQTSQTIQPGYIYIAPPDYHLLIKRGYFTLGHGPRENRHRPAVDPLFRSAARSYGKRVIGAVLTGMLDDGTAGLLEVKRHGGVTIAQDPLDALYPSMPQSAIEHVPCDYIVSLDTLALMLPELVMQTVPEDLPAETREIEVDIAEMDVSGIYTVQLPGNPSPFSCPDCGGVLWELQDGMLTRFRCRVGHAFSAQTLAAAHAASVEETLWTALRALEESASYSRRMVGHSQQQNQGEHNSELQLRAQQAERYADTLREILAEVRSNFISK